MDSPDILSVVATIFRSQFWFHLGFPLLAGLVIRVVFVALKKAERPKVLELVLESVSILVVYFGIAIYEVRSVSRIELGGTEQAVLQANLQNARSYFATSAIPIEEWFEPISQVFLSRIVRHKMGPHPLQDQRVLLLFDADEDRDLRAPYLTGYYGRSLATIHSSLGTPIGFLVRAEILTILSQLTTEEKTVIGYSPAWTRQRRIPELDFALVEGEKGKKTVLRVKKEGQNLRIEPIDGPGVNPYEHLIELIRARTGLTRGAFDAQHDFVKFYFP